MITALQNPKRFYILRNGRSDHDKICSNCGTNEWDLARTQFNTHKISKLHFSELK